MNCRKINSLISAYMDGELTGVDQMLVREHLRVCSECQEEHESLQITKRMISSLGYKEPRADLEGKILEILALEKSPVTIRDRFLNWWTVLSMSQRRFAEVGVLFAIASITTSIFYIHANNSSNNDNMQARSVNISASISQPDRRAPMKDYLYIHHPYAWDDAQPSISSASIAPAGIFNTVNSASGDTANGR